MTTPSLHSVYDHSFFLHSHTPSNTIRSSQDTDYCLALCKQPSLLLSLKSLPIPSKASIAPSHLAMIFYQLAQVRVSITNCDHTLNTCDLHLDYSRK